MQAIAVENNLSETAFFVATGDAYELRWFTPAAEVDLCGHATLASAYVVFEHLEKEAKVVRFNTRSGRLTVARDEDVFWRAPSPSCSGEASQGVPSAHREGIVHGGCRGQMYGELHDAAHQEVWALLMPQPKEHGASLMPLPKGYCLLCEAGTKRVLGIAEAATKRV